MSNFFESWNLKKIETDEIIKTPFFHKREIWWMRIGKNIGFEQDGKGKNFLRPVVVFRKFNSRVFWGIPLSKTKNSGCFYFKFSFKNTESTAILSQLRLFDAKRLHDRYGVMSKNNFENLEKAVQTILNDF